LFKEKKRKEKKKPVYGFFLFYFINDFMHGANGPGKRH